MTITAVILLLFSAVTHALWNLLSKREHPSTAFFLAANTIGCLLLAPIAIFYWRYLRLFPVNVWILIAITGLCMAVYFAALAGAYRSGDMSIAYPMARSSPLIVVTVVTLFLGQGDDVSIQCIAGIVFVVGGCFILPMAHFSDFRLKNYFNATCALALCAAFGTAGYSIIDDRALDLLRTNPNIELNTAMVSILYAFTEAASCSIWLLVYTAVGRKRKIELRQIFRMRKTKAALAGLGIYLTYVLVLISMAFVKNVSYVVAFRQLSVPIGAALGMLVLRESCSLPKLVGIAAIFAGLLFVGIG